MTIRTALPADAEALLSIYAPYVLHTAITFEYEVPDVEAFRSRIESTLREYPFLAAEEAGRIVGYAYAGEFKRREAYRHSAELSVYVKGDERGRGAGRLLYSALEERLAAQNVYNAYACIAVPHEEPDPYLTRASERFHAKMGYRTVARFEACGYKFGRWYSMIWMGKRLKETLPDPQPFIPFGGQF